MRDQRRATVNELRQAIDCLPPATKMAMLDGIANNPIIVGAYTDGGDGVCPMLAAHRAGGRTSFITFAKAWDRFAYRGSRARRARRATERELLVLRAQLEASLLADDGPSPELAAAMADHQQLKGRRAREEAQALGAEECAELARERSCRREQRQARRRSRREHPRVRPGDPDRSRELHDREGWAWTTVVRRYDDYERALQRIEAGQAALGARSAPAEGRRELAAG